MSDPLELFPEMYAAAYSGVPVRVSEHVDGVPLARRLAVVPLFGELLLTPAEWDALSRRKAPR